MALFQDNISPYISFVEGSAPASPAATNFRLYYDSADHLLKWKNSAGTVTAIATGTALADQGVFTYLDGTVAAAPATPAAGKLRLYAKTGKVLAVKDDAGVETVLGAGGGSGALVFLEAHTASASATLNFTAFISATYDDYLFEIVNIMPATTNTNFLMRMGTGAGPTWDSGANYGWAGWRWAPGGTATAGTGSGLTSLGLDASGGVKSDTVLPFSGSWRLFDPQNTTPYKRVMGQAGYVDNAGTIIGCTHTGLYLSATAVTGVQFLFSSGNITSGLIRAYGITKS